jgi:hypothetical protein
MKDRKAFNFYRSYFEIGKELDDKDRLAFYDAIILKQFENKNTKLEGMAKFAYLSQLHSIEKQIEGYNSKIKSIKKPLQKTKSQEDIKSPWQGSYVGGWQGGKEGASVQEKGQEKGQVQEKEKEQEKEKVPVKKNFVQYVVQTHPKKEEARQAGNFLFDKWKNNNWQLDEGTPIKNWKAMVNKSTKMIENYIEQNKTRKAPKSISGMF